MIGARSEGVAASIASIVSAAALLGSLGLGTAPVQAHPHVWVTSETTVLYENGTIVGLRQKWSFDDFYTSMALQGLDTNNDGVYDRSELAALAQVNIDGLKEFDYFTVVKLASETLKFKAPTDFYLEHAEGPASRSEVAGTTDGARDAKAASPPPEPEPGFFSRWWSWAFGAPSDKDSTAKAGAPPAPTKVLSLHFTLPLAQPVLADAPGFSFAISDPSFFIALEPAAKDAVVLGPGAPVGCRVAVAETESAPDAATPPPGTPPAADAPATATEPNPAADLNRLGDAFSQQFGSGSVATRFGRSTSISCGQRS
jgi:ABC-type uncharacterized transport system substrate-binding protein